MFGIDSTDAIFLRQIDDDSSTLLAVDCPDNLNDFGDVDP